MDDGAGRPDGSRLDPGRFDEESLPGVPLPVEGARRHVTLIDNASCIGCTKCILACPFDAIVGALKHQHHVIAARCTGCDLCAVPCPTDCISTRPLDMTWTAHAVARARSQAEQRLRRRAGTQSPNRPQAALPATGTVLERLSAPDEKQRRLAGILAAAARRGQVASSRP